MGEEAKFVVKVQDRFGNATHSTSLHDGTSGLFGLALSPAQGATTGISRSDTRNIKVEAKATKTTKVRVRVRG